MIKFINTNKWFNNRHILKNIHLDIAKGEVIVICGPSGAGKSTLLRTINKLEQIDDGEIIVDGMYLSDPKTNLTSLRAEIGVVFQQFNLYPHKTSSPPQRYPSPNINRTPSRKKTYGGGVVLQFPENQCFQCPGSNVAAVNLTKYGVTHTNTTTNH